MASFALCLLLTAAAFTFSFVVVRFVERRARSLTLVDIPNERSSHVQPRPRGGGIGIVVGVVLGAGAAELVGLHIDPSVWVVLVAGVVVSLAGLWDDLRGLGIWPRLAVQTVVAVIVVLGTGGIDHLPLPAPADLPLGPLSVLLTVIWLVGVTNFFNFMDGIDGLAAGQAVITLVALAIVTWPGGVATTALICVGATLAFLVRNWSPARIFLGDVGSAFLGFLLAGLPLASGQASASRVLLVAISLALFLLDPVATLVRRATRRARIGISHREHAYQQFVPAGAPHGPVVVRLLLVAAGLSFLAIVAYWFPSAGWAAVTAAAVAFAIEWQLAARRRPRATMRGE